MNLPFTTEQFLQVFSDYNMAVWPIQILFNLAALAAVSVAIWKTKITDRLVSGILAFLWVWMGVVYHWTYFSSINKAAFLFGALFILQGLFFLWTGVVQHTLAFRSSRSLRGVLGATLMTYGLIVYPLLGNWLGHVYPQSPTFGLPCPTTIFTFGILLWAERRVPAWLLVIPFLWTIMGTSAACNFGILEDIGLIISGLLGTTVLMIRNRRMRVGVGQC